MDVELKHCACTLLKTGPQWSCNSFKDGQLSPQILFLEIYLPIYGQPMTGRHIWSLILIILAAQMEQNLLKLIARKRTVEIHWFFLLCRTAVGSSNRKCCWFQLCGHKKIYYLYYLLLEIVSSPPMWKVKIAALRD